MAFPALNHVAVTVRDLAVSGPWYRALIGAEPVLDEHTDAGFQHLVWLSTTARCSASTSTTARLTTSGSASSGSGWTMSASAARTAPSCRPGWSRLDELGIEHGGIVDASYGSGLSFRDPDGIALEFFAPPS